MYRDVVETEPEYLYEVGQTDATDSDFFPVPPSLGRDARKLVSRDRLLAALSDVSAGILAPLPQRHLCTPTDVVQASTVDSASLSVAVTLCRAEVWGLPPQTVIRTNHALSAVCLQTEKAR